LTDPALARALAAMHEHPEWAWSVDSLAATAALSRTAFANRFRELAGLTPGAYLARLRMDLAREWLQAGVLSMDEIAARSGYASTAAFAKAFKQVTGVPPGQVRLAARAARPD
jgi:transcriptional regulator GlxA family with amidase domain